MKQIYIFIGILAFAGLFACKKNKGEKNYNQLAKDTAVANAREVYLWYKQLPSNLNGNNYADPDAVMKAIRPYSKEPGFANAVDRWSFGILKKDWENISSGVGADFGMKVFFKSASDLRVAAVDKNGPAGTANIKRGWKINSINGVVINDTSQSSFIVNTVYYAPTTRFNFTQPDNSTREVTLNSQIFTGNPFLHDSVYTYGSNKVGYFVLDSFLGDTTQVRNNFDRVFNRFGSAGVTDVVVDLRYNGGGFVSLAQYLLNYLVPTAGNGQTMFTQSFNDKYAARWNSTAAFNKKGGINLSRIFFIVTKQSASASELVINSLRPFTDVKIVGPTNSHGKPVGYFPLSAGNWYVFPASFRLTNKNNEANYFNGFAPDYTTADGLDKNWGDVDESCLSKTIRFITTGSWARIAPTDATQLNEQLRVVTTNNYLNSRRFKGMVGKPIQFK